MMVKEKGNEIEIMRKMGEKRGEVMRILMMKGDEIGVKGKVEGVIMGVVV